MTALSSQPPPPQPEDTEVLTLQFIRGIAAALVVVVHLADRLLKRGMLGAGPDDPIWSLGYIGVATFFVISGFIMVYTTWNRFGREKAAPRFLARRLVRIAPLYYLTTAAALIFYYVTFSYSTNAEYFPPTIDQIIRSALFIPYVDVHGLLMPVYGVGWTLQYEMFFYLLFSGGLLLRRSRGLMIVLAALLALVLAGTRLHSVDQSASTLQTIAWFVTRPILLYFVSGMLLAIVLRRYGPFRVAIPAPLITAIGAGTMIVGGLTTVVPTIVLATIAIAITGLVEQKRRVGPFANLCRMLGNASYSVYLTHTFALGIIALLAARAPAPRILSVPLAFVVGEVICFLVGWCVWRFVEVPIAQWFKRSESRDRGD